MVCLSVAYRDAVWVVDSGVPLPKKPWIRWRVVAQTRPGEEAILAVSGPLKNIVIMRCARTATHNIPTKTPAIGNIQHLLTAKGYTIRAWGDAALCQIALITCLQIGLLLRIKVAKGAYRKNIHDSHINLMNFLTMTLLTPTRIASCRLLLYILCSVYLCVGEDRDADSRGPNDTRIRCTPDYPTGNSTLGDMNTTPLGQ